MVSPEGWFHLLVSMMTSKIKLCTLSSIFKGWVQSECEKLNNFASLKGTVWNQTEPYSKNIGGRMCNQQLLAAWVALGLVGLLLT